jgi:hypothetical protein
MKRIVALVFASAAIVVPGTAAFATPDASQPLGFECLVADGIGAPEATYALTNCGSNRNQ